jgi:hypothetical protein
MTWQELLKSVLETKEKEIDCHECYELLDQYVDFILAGNDPTEMMPDVREHLYHCACCTGEFEALMVMLQEEIANNRLASLNQAEEER